MDRINNSVSFQGTIRIKSFYKSFRGTFLEDIKTTKTQDKKISDLASTITEKTTRTDRFPEHISSEKANKFYELLENIIGHPLRNIKNQKVIHYGDRHISFGDYDAKWCGGETYSISLDA